MEGLDTKQKRQLSLLESAYQLSESMSFILLPHAYFTRMRILKRSTEVFLAVFVENLQAFRHFDVGPGWLVTVISTEEGAC